MPKSKKSKKTTLIVFEGPDMCGKSSHVDSVTKMLESSGNKVTHFKYPDYSGKYGDETLDFLNNFDISKNSIEKNISMVFNKEYIDFCNKIFSKDKLIELSKKNDIIILDRFYISQFVYTLAWAFILSSYKYNPSLKHKWSINKYFRDIDYIVDSACNHYKDIIEFFKDNFEIKTIVFKKSKFVSYKAMKTRNTKDISKYDTFENYQICVSRLFEYLFDTSTKIVVPPQAGTIVDRFSKNLMDIANEIALNTIGRVDTDSAFDYAISNYNDNHKESKIIMTDFESEDKYIEKVLNDEDIVKSVYDGIDKYIDQCILLSLDKICDKEYLND